MPEIYCDYHPPAWLRGGHLQTLIPHCLRGTRAGKSLPAPEPVTIDLPDGDVLWADLYEVGEGGQGKLDQIERQAPREVPLLILAHGLEGSARSGYILGMAAAAIAQGWSVLAWNLRSCGPKLNRTPAIYHSGCSEDLEQVILWARHTGWSRIKLGGFSLGGNVVLKWLGERGEDATKYGVQSAVAASVPLDLRACVRTLEKPINWLYHKHFVRSMKQRIRAKAEQFPEHFDLALLSEMKSLWELDDRFTAPLNGFRDAEDYYARCSARFFLDAICTPTLLVTAGNDPFFSSCCYPHTQTAASEYLTFEAPKGGGHVGFWSGPGRWWLEHRFMHFFLSEAK